MPPHSGCIGDDATSAQWAGLVLICPSMESIHSTDLVADHVISKIYILRPRYDLLLRWYIICINCVNEKFILVAA